MRIHPLATMHVCQCHGSPSTTASPHHSSLSEASCLVDRWIHTVWSSLLNCPTHMWKSKLGRMQDVHCHTATLSGTGAFSWERGMLAEDISHHLISLPEHLLSGFLNRSCNEVKSTPPFMPSIHSRPQNKPNCMYGSQVYTEFRWDSGMKVTICAVAKSGHGNDDLPDGSFKKWDTEWTYAKTRLWEGIQSCFGNFVHSVEAVRESWWHNCDFLAEHKLFLQTNNVHRSRCWTSVMMEVCLQGFSQLLVQTVFSLQKTVDW